MEKIAIFDTSSATPTPPSPIESPALSLIYGTFADDDRILSYTGNIGNGFCNLIGGGGVAVADANDNSVRGNYFIANYDIQSNLNIAFGEVYLNPTIVVRLFESGTEIETWSIVTSGSNFSQSLVFQNTTSFRSASVYYLRFGLDVVDSYVEILGWSIAVSYAGI
jgi:hypothetical protein